jgi:integrase
MARSRRASYGEGSVYQRDSDGKWVAVVLDEGKRRTLYGATRNEVLAKREALRAALHYGEPAPDLRLTVGEHLIAWLESKRPPNVRPATWISYEAQVNLHLAPLHRIALAKLTPNDVRNLVRGLLDEGLSPRSAGYALVILRMALRQAVADRLIGRNVATYVEMPRREQVEIQPLSPLQARQLVAAAREDRRGGLWILLLGTGLRLGEALGLRWADIDLEDGKISVRGSLRPQPLKLRGSDPRLALVETKTAASRRTIAGPAFVLAALRQHQARSAEVPANVMNLLFTTPRGTPIDPRNANRQFGEFLRRNELPQIRVHDLRHTAASLLLAQGFTLEDVKRYLGHSSIVQTSNTYGHLVAGRSAEVAAGMDRAVIG